MIKLKKLDKYFYKGKKNQIHVLNDISLELEEKGLVAIQGSSGSGKTTLLNVIGGLDKIHSGEIDFNDEYIPKYKSRVWDKIRNEYVGYIFQNYYLLPDLSVYENIRLVLKNLGLSDEKEIESRIHYVLNALGMYPFRKKKALQLSGGQQQRVAIARALVKNPKVIIADEPTGNLDSKNTIEIMNIIKRISKETLVILVTHEKELANLYADRIITLEDGKITDDYQNDQLKDHNIDDDAIYLKDIKNQKNLKNEEVQVDIYYDKPLDDVNVKLILKNETLYVDIKGYKNVQLIDDFSNVVIKDEHYTKKTKEEVQQTTYDVKELDHKHAKKEKGFLFSFKKMFFDAFKKLITIGRKGKLMLFSFFVAGMIIAFSVASFAAVLIIDVEEYLPLPKGYVEYDKALDSPVTLSDLKGLQGDTKNFYINPYLNGVSLDFLNSNNTVGLSQNAMVDNIEHAKKYQLIKGKYATNKNEIVVSKAFADNFLSSVVAQDFGIWREADLFKEKIAFTEKPAKIVGIVDTKIDLIFASEEFLIYNHDISSFDFFKPLEAFDEINLVKGSKPINEDDVLVNEAFLNHLGYQNIEEVSFPLSAQLDVFITSSTNNNYNIVGIHDFDDVLVLVKKELIKNFIVLENYKGYIYSNNPNKIINNLEDILGLESKNIYQDSYKGLKAMRKQTITGASITTIILVGATLIGFYFVIRSSLIERIYEVAVYRALGVKKREIFSTFIVEIVLITTITTFIGFSLMSYILVLINRGFIGMFASFKVNPLTYLSGVFIVYSLNLIAGLLPVITLLRKTPAEILSQYDI